MVLVTFKELQPFASVWELVLCLGVLCAGIAASQYLLSNWCRDKARRSILVSLFVCFMLFFGDLRMHLEKWLLGTQFIELTRLRYLLVLCLVAYLLASWVVLRTRRDLERISGFLSVTSALMVLVTMLQISVGPSKPEILGNSRAEIPLKAGPTRPDIYLILCDGYTSSESLRDYWNYDNSSFTAFLEENGFHVIPDARGNASFTPVCMATTLNMDYPPPYNSNERLVGQAAYHGMIINAAEAPRRLISSGYELINLSLFRVAGKPRAYPLSPVGSSSFLEKVFEKTVIGYVRSYTRRTAIADVNLSTISQLTKISEQPSEKPRFVYAHVMMPHSPFLFDRDGNRVMRGFSKGEVNSQDYLEQLIYLNRLLTNSVSQILRNSKTPPIIIIQGDHGFRRLPEAIRKDAATRIMNAWFLPGATPDWFRPGITPVNTFRLVFNKVFGEEYEFVPDRTQWGIEVEE